MAYRVLDLFCGEGGASEGYRRAGFDVLGVDLSPMPRYPGNVVQADALELLRAYANGYSPLGRFDLVHASPPCQGYSVMSECRPGLADEYPKLIGPVRGLLAMWGVNYVIENVPGAPLRNATVLCGSQFGLYGEWNDEKVVLRRHRLFEATFTIPDAGPHTCDSYLTVPVYGNGAPGNRPEFRGPGFEALRKQVMGIDWMTRAGLSEAIPPAYAEHVGLAFRAAA